MTQVAMVDIQPNLDLEEAIYNLIKFEEVEEGNIGLKKLYDLIGCRIVERVVLGKLNNGNLLDLIIDEEGSFGQWNRGVAISNEDKHEYQILGNCIFVQATPDGDWIGWDNEVQMANDINPYVNSIKFFELAEK